FHFGNCFDTIEIAENLNYKILCTLEAGVLCFSWGLKILWFIFESLKLFALSRV
ncbi:unnamed protein product, partial [Sphenostylis stenocarpa]